MQHGLSLGNFQFGFLILTYHPGEEYRFKYSGMFNLSNVICPFDFMNSSCCLKMKKCSTYIGIYTVEKR